VLVVHGTVSPVAVGSFAAALRDEHGVCLIDAPLSGGTAGARTGTLSVMAGGERAVADRLAPLFAHYARTLRYLGPSGSGALAKACNQIVVAGTVTAVSEALLLARRTGVDPAALVDILRGGLADSEVLRQKAGKWLDDDFGEGGSAANQLKDLEFALELSSARGLRLPLTRTVAGLFNEMVERGDGALDHTGVIRTIARQPDPG
jgi:2-hydroxy-3-oxopropionate reductase